MKNVEESNAPLPVLRIDEAHRKTKVSPCGMVAPAAMVQHTAILLPL